MSDITWTNITVKLGDLKPWQDNPRHSTKAQAKRILASFEQFGQAGVILVDPDNNVLDGHQRLSALLTIHGDKYEIEARRSSRALTDAERRGLVLALANATGSWDWDRLSAWSMADLDQWGFDGETLKAWNNDANNLKEMLKSEQPSADAPAETDRAAELLEKWQVKPGDLWQIGEHRLVCGDSTNKATYEKLLDGQLVQMVMTSPPYWVGKDYENEKAWSEVLSFIADVSDAIAPCLPEQGRIVINTGTGMRGKFDGHTEISLLLDEWVIALRRHGWLMRHPRIWAKSGGLGGLVGPQSDVVDLHWEFIATFYKPHKPFIGQRRVSSAAWANQGVWTDIQGNANQTGHVASFPTEIPERNIALYSDEGDVILEPFSGSGTTLVACENLLRRCRACEISPAYVAVALERMATAFPALDIRRIE